MPILHEKSREAKSTMEMYMPAMGDRVQLRKKHPCGSDTWTVVRLGADIGIVCEGCGRRVLLERPVFRKRVKRVLPPAKENESGL